MVSVPTQTLGCQPGVPRGSGGANANWSLIQGHWSTPKEILLWGPLRGQSHAFPITRTVPPSLSLHQLSMVGRKTD